MMPHFLPLPLCLRLSYSLVFHRSKYLCFERIDIMIPGADVDNPVDDGG